VAWQQLILRLDAGSVPRAEAMLRLAGAVSLATSDAGDDPVLEPEPGETPLWPTVVLRALFPENADAGRLAALAASQLGIAAAAIDLDELDDADWIDAQRQSIAPLTIGEHLRILPAAHAAEEAAAGDVLMSMGLAFGTGRHPTTRLCLDWLAVHVEPGIRVLDYGCGSGILALAALRLGAAAAFAVDTEPQALLATRNNAELNALGEKLWIGSPGALPAIRPDLIVANILARPLIDLAATLSGLQAAGGQIVLSGLLGDQLPEVSAAYGSYYEDLRSVELDGWARLTGRRQSWL
jgi:ribosomal protein L11 methyltransferase